MTVEDPIEYYIDGIGQTQVNTKVEMTFARGLRAILRQDPDVVHDRRDPRPRDGADRRAGEPHRTPGALDPAHQHRGRRGHAPARHGHRAVPALLEPHRRARAAPGPGAESGEQAALPGRRLRAAAAQSAARGSLAGALPPGARCHGRLPRPLGRLRADRGRRRHAHHDPRRRRASRSSSATPASTTPSIRDDGVARILRGETTIEEVLRVTRED